MRLSRPIALLFALISLPASTSAHEIPSDVTVRMLVRPADQRVQLLVRAPLEAMQDITFPTFGPGYLDVPRADRQLRDAAQLWLADNIELYEGERRLPLDAFPPVIGGPHGTHKAQRRWASQRCRVRGQPRSSRPYG